MLLNKLKNEKILILGFGREGRDTLLFLRKLFPKKVFGIADVNEVRPRSNERGPTSLKWHLGKNYLKAINDYDIVIKSPGIPYKNLPKNALAKITTQTEIFFDNCPGKIIGITGTKGKSTTSSFIYQTLKKGGVSAHLVGNIGKPVLSLLSKAKKDDIFVYELSSHQLFNLKKSPHIAVLLNIYPEHLDYYKNFNEYVLAKANIAKYQTKNDYLIYNSQDPLISKIAQKSKAKKIPIKGKYYQLNVEATKKVAGLFKVPELKKFKLLPHRLEFVGKFKGIEFYNDSLSTIPQTTIEALDYLGNKVQTLILGGYDRGLSFKKLGERIKKSKVKTLILFPTTGKRIWKELGSFQKKDLNYFFVNDMENAVRLAFEHTNKDKICLLSPASPSFGVFKDYEERGDLFKKFVKA
ncbi:MAG: UDP-N-acetylmuramoyl-L-alanine--D-glutamate ligase [Candidatus Nealsonbacteria bacterium]|nr:UDP-N-acetylmuramoyl-L-alanine--D-glutamate ligase [Candidatus Nealsonbacteria bacterium]